MDRYDLVLDIVRHPENYDSEQLEEIFSDNETRRIYNLLCKVESSAKRSKNVDVEAEWIKFRANRLGRHVQMSRRFNNRAASVVIVTVLSIAAVVAGIVVTNVVVDSNPETAGSEYQEAAGTVIPADTLSETKNVVEIRRKPVLFEDVALETIMDEVAAEYDVSVVFKNETAAQLHLYYTFDPSLPLDEIVEQLNTFERINIVFGNGTLIIE